MAASTRRMRFAQAKCGCQMLPGPDRVAAVTAAVLAPQDRQHVRRRDIAGEDFGLVARLHAIDKSAVGRRIGVEMRAEAAVDERVDQVRMGEE